MARGGNAGLPVGLGGAVSMLWVNSRRQHLCQQLLRLLLLDLQLLRPLSDQLLQVRRVLLQHPQHGVYDVGLFPLVDVLKLRCGG